jgi:mono/diheme cytochrome c family protein
VPYSPSFDYALDRVYAEISRCRKIDPSRLEDAMTKKMVFMMLLASLGIPFFASAQTSTAGISRGELLYATHCIACHNEKIHWRDRRVAGDWAGLISQVRHWQQISGLAWHEDDIVLVAHYLNVRLYHYPEHAK